jgi:PAS domain S-box-containing protein
MLERQQPNILLFSQKLFTKQLIEDSLKKLEPVPTLIVAGSMKEVLQIIIKIEPPIVIIDQDMLDSLPEGSIDFLFRFNEYISFVLVHHSLKEEEIYHWTILGFSDVVSECQQSLTISIFKELRNFVKIQDLLEIERELRYTNKLMKCILDNIPAGVFWKDKNYQYIGCNKEHARALGLTDTKDIQGKTDHDFHYSTEKVEQFHRDDNQVIREGLSLHNITYYLRYDGKETWTETNKVPLLDHTETIIGVIGLYKDITEQVLLEKAVKKREELLSLIFSNTHICFVYLDNQFNFISANEAYLKVIRQPIESIVGKNHFDLFPGEEIRSMFIRVVKNGEPFIEYDRPYTFPDHPEWGTSYWDWSLTPIKDAKGRVTNLLFSLRDVSEKVINQRKLEETELLYTHVFSAMTEGIIILDKNAEQIAYNRSAKAIVDSYCTDFKKKCPFVNEELAEVPAENFPFHITLRTGKPCRNIVLGILTGAKDYQWFSINTQPVISPETGELTQVVMSFVDITESKRMEQELFTKKRMEAIGSMAGKIVHDMNNILQPIMLISEILKDNLKQLTKTEQTEIDSLISLTDKIFSSVVRGKNLIHEILTYTQNIAEPISLETIDLVKVIQETCDEFQLLKKESISIEFYTSLETAKFNASAANIHQVIYNLFNNAIYAMKDKENGILSISLNKVKMPEEQNFLSHQFSEKFAYQMIVKDTGSGIKKENLEKVFEPFFSTKKKDGGTGLGLSSVYSIVQKLKGNISVVSRESVGSRFTIYLPIMFDIK